MPTEASGAGNTPAMRRAVPISKRIRIAAATLGLACLGAGGTAVFLRDVEAGPVALIAAGVLFVFVGLAGYMPTRLKVGDNEAEWQLEEYREIVAEFVDEAPRAEQERVIERLASIDPPAAVSAMGGITYERTILGMLKEVVESRGDRFADGPAIINDFVRVQFDAVIMRADNKRQAVVEIRKVRSSMTTDWVEELHNELLMAAVAGHLEVQMLLLIVDHALSLATQKRLNDFADIRYIVCGGRHDMQILQIAVEGVIGLTPVERTMERPGDGNN